MKKIYKSFSIVTISSIATRFISFIFKIYLSRFLGAEILGIYQIVFSVFLLLSCFSTAGIGVTTSRLIAENNNNYKKTNMVLSSCLLISLIFAIIPFLLIVFFPSILSIFIKDSRAIQLIYIICPMFITSSLYTVFRSYLWGKKEFKLFSLTELLDEIFKVISTIILIVFCANKYIDNLYIYAISLIVGDILLIIVLFIIMKFKKAKLDKPLFIKKVLAISAPITISRLISSILNFFISIMLPSLLVSKFNLSTYEATSEYGRASGMVMGLIFAPNALLSSIAIILIPEIIQLKNSNKIDQLKNKINYSILISVVISCIFMIFYIALGENLGSILYKDTLVGKYLSISSIMMLPIGVNLIVSSFLNTLKKEKSVFFTYCISSVFLVLIILFTTKYIGIYSYFLALFIFHLTNCILNLVILNKLFKLNCTLATSSISILSISIILSYSLFIINKSLNFSILINTFITISIGLILIAIAILPFYTYFFRKNPKIPIY